MSEKFWRTNELITLEKCERIYERYKGNWNTLGLNQYQKRMRSENGEDGVLEQVFEEIGPGTKYYVEFGARDGYAISNTIYFREHLGWSGLLLDCAYEDDAINLRKEFITAENINDIFREYGVPKRFDLLSIDIDGNGFWVWQALKHEYQPRVVIIETNQLVSPLEDRTIVYDPNFVWDYDSRYFGAGLLTMYKLGRSNNYSLR